MNPDSVSRRSFLQTTVFAGGAAVFQGSLLAQNEPAVQADEFPEPGRNLPLVNDADVIVCGGGPAGVAAAITAARVGARVRLFEWRGCLGGVWTAGLLGYFLDFNKPGFAKELRDKLDKRNARADSTDPGSFCYHPEELKLLLEELCAEAGVKFQFHTRVAAAFREGKRLTTIVTESKAGRQAWKAPVFIDATGDGDLGAQAGCAFQIGEEADCPCQPMSLNALLVVKDVEALRDFVRFGKRIPGENRNFEKKMRIRDSIASTGHVPSYSSPTILHVRGNLVFAMLNHEYGIKPWDAAEITTATVRARAEMNKMVKGLSSLGGPWEGIQIVATAEQIGVRDGRRISGRYTMRKGDLVEGTRYDDGVARVTFPADVHATTKELASAGNSNYGVESKPYDIPLRALIAKDVDGLMMAGRCISGDFIAHSSYRVTGNAVAMGEAAGVTAALASTTKRMPHEVPWNEGKAKLEAMG